MGIVEEDAPPLLDESSLFANAGTSHFVVVIPTYSMELMENAGDIEMNEMAQSLAHFVKSHFDSIKETMSYSCEYSVVILGHSMYEPEGYPITESP